MRGEDPSASSKALSPLFLHCASLHIWTQWSSQSQLFLVHSKILQWLILGLCCAAVLPLEKWGSFGFFPDYQTISIPNIFSFWNLCGSVQQVPKDSRGDGPNDPLSLSLKRTNLSQLRLWQECFRSWSLSVGERASVCSRDPKGPEGLSASGLRCFHWDEIPRDWC